MPAAGTAHPQSAQSIAAGRHLDRRMHRSAFRDRYPKSFAADWRYSRRQPQGQKAADVSDQEGLTAVCALLRRDPMRGNAAALDHDFDGIIDTILGVANRSRQIVECKGMRVNLGGIEALLRHEGFSAMGRALAFAADAVEINVAAHDMGNIDRRFGVWERGQTNFA